MQRRDLFLYVCYKHIFSSQASRILYVSFPAAPCPKLERCAPVPSRGEPKMRFAVECSGAIADLPSSSLSARDLHQRHLYGRTTEYKYAFPFFFFPLLQEGCCGQQNSRGGPVAVELDRPARCFFLVRQERAGCARLRKASGFLAPFDDRIHHLHRSQKAPLSSGWLGRASQMNVCAHRSGHSLSSSGVRTVPYSTCPSVSAVDARHTYVLISRSCAWRRRRK